MKKLDDILTNVSSIKIIGTLPEFISGIAFDSRKVERDCVFVATKGTKTDSHIFIPQVIDSGARVIICEDVPQVIHKSTAYIQVNDSQEALGIMASNYYGNPSEKLILAGITGTNGKTSTVTMLYNLFAGLGYACGLLSTVQNVIAGEVIPSTHTTPDALQINKLLNEMVERGCEFCFMEVSSHALVQHRVTGLNFSLAIFSNITHDHLDYHGTFAEYIKAKKLFFDRLGKTAYALINQDDKNGRVMTQNTRAKVMAYSIESMADFKGRIIESTFEGLHLRFDKTDFWVPMIGKFNAYNLLAVYATALIFKQNQEEVVRLLSSIAGAEGRFDVIRSAEGITAIIDYAHTPDAMKNVLSTINDIRTGNEKLITVVGAGGDRDKTKRPEMAALSVELSNMVILTSDNPRSENPEDILKDMQAGVPPHLSAKVLTITNRKEAIKTAFALAAKNDIILVAGKGHEKYQEIQGVKHHFDDKEVIQQIINKK